MGVGEKMYKNNKNFAAFECLKEKISVKISVFKIKKLILPIHLKTEN